MLLEELMDEEYSKGKAEGKNEGRAEGRAAFIMKVLSKYGDISEEARTRISTITDINKLDELFASALNLNSAEDLEEFIQNL